MFRKWYICICVWGKRVNLLGKCWCEVALEPVVWVHGENLDSDVAFVNLLLNSRKCVALCGFISYTLTLILKALRE